MRLSHLILREIRYRSLNFAMGVLSVVVAVGCLVGATTLLRSYDAKTDQLAEERARQVLQNTDEAKEQMRQLQEDFRKLTLKMGFTTIIVHKDQDLADLFARGYPTIDMPEEHGDKLAAKKVLTLNHVLPTLQKRTAWKERNDTEIQLIGVKGEVYIQSKFQKPLLEPIAPGSMVIGKEIERRLGLKVNQKVTLAGREYTITGIRAGSGGAQDLGVWIPLADVQQFLQKPGRINAIYAVDCMCPGDRVSAIRAEINKILPDVQIFEVVDVATARAESRQRVEEAAKRIRRSADEAADQERAARAAMRSQRESLARFLVPTVVIGCALWIGLLTWSNVRDRRNEIGILRAIGLRGSQILSVFLAKSLVIGLIGAGIGYAAGFVVGQSFEAGQLRWSGAMFDPRMLGMMLAAAPIMACAASGLPAVLAARQDPAVVLQRE